MNRWILVSSMAVLAAGCGDDSTTGTGGGGGAGGSTTSTTSTSTGDGGGGGDAGGGGTGGNLLGGCAGPGECGADERCDFPDGLCGAGEPGTCVPRSGGCGDTGNSLACLCSGGLVGVDYTCDDEDADETGSCAVPDDVFKCVNDYCLEMNGAFCRIVSDDTGGPDGGSCGFANGCDAVTDCACLAAEIEACGGTCEEGTPPTVRCPGG